MGDSVTIGVVEDDPDQSQLFAAWLGEAGYKVRQFASAAEFRRRLGAESVDVVILDWMLPDTPGIDVLDWLRHSTQAQLPVVFLTAKTSESDIVAGLSAGADDYIAKPARKAELLARIDAVLRRAHQPVTAPVPTAHGDRLQFEDVEIDLAQRVVTRAGTEVKLTHLEFELLVFFLRHPSQVFSRTQLFNLVWGQSAGSVRTVDNFVGQLRKRLEGDPDRPRHFVTVRGSGYRFDP